MTDNFKPVQVQKLRLAGSGCTATATSITLDSFALVDGTLVTMTNFGTIGAGTLEPGTSKEEMISFTGITQNADGTATLTGVTRGLRFVSPYDEVSANKQAHAGGAIFVISNTAGFYDKFAIKDNDETITGTWIYSIVPQTTSDPSNGDDLARRSWVLSVVNGGAVSTNSIIVTGTAGETVAAGNLVYLKVSDSRWWLADADLTATVDGVILGIAQGSGTAGNTITNGVLLQGSYTTTGLTANSTYYASNTAGAIATSAGTITRKIGVAISTTVLYFDANFGNLPTALQVAQIPTAGQKQALAGSFGTPSTSNTYYTSTDPKVGTISVTAGETITGATLPVPIYQNKTDNEFYMCDANDATKYKFLGFAISNGTDGASMTAQFSGIVSGFTGLDEGEKYYVSDTVGTIANSPGTQEILVGIAISPTQLLIQKGRRVASGTATFNSTTTSAITLGFRPSKISVYSSSGTTGSDYWMTSMGGWDSKGGNSCVYAGGYDDGSNIVSGINGGNAWYSFEPNGTNGNQGSIISITDTGFTLNNSEGGTSVDCYVYWQAEGDL